jgi:outer membrane protein, multidrug efflux system
MHNVRRFSFAVAVGMAPIATLPAAAQVEAPRAVQPALGAHSAAAVVDPSASTFWEVLNDTTLDRLMQQALRGNLELRAAAARLDGAGAARTQAALELVPSVSASAGYTRRRLSSASFPGAAAAALPDQNVWASGLDASWELDVFGRLRGGLRARNALLDAAGEDVSDARVDLAAAVARTYLDLRGAQNQLAVARRNADNQRRTLELTQTRLDAGRGTAFDTERAQAQLSFTLAAIPALESQIAGAQYRIAVLVGRSPQELAGELASEAPLPELPETVPAIATAEAVRMRPDVRSAADRVAASRALVSSARADFLPRLSLAAGAGYAANAFDSFGNSGTFNYTFGPVISWPAFDIGRVKARVDQARAQELEARARHEHAELRAAEEIEAATVRYRTERARLEHLRDAAAASERAAALATLRYEGGIADFLQVLDAERTLLAAQDQLAQAQTQAADAYIALFRARGASWPVERRGSR